LCFICLAGFTLAISAPAAEPEKSKDRLVSDEIAPPKFLAAWGQEGTGPGQFKSPIGIAINAADDVFITDAGNSCVE
jgi:hypothetical protein